MPECENIVVLYFNRTAEIDNEKRAESKIDVRGNINKDNKILLGNLLKLTGDLLKSKFINISIYRPVFMQQAKR